MSNVSDADVAVGGGGVVGLACAHAIEQRGMSGRVAAELEPFRPLRRM